MRKCARCGTALADDVSAPGCPVCVLQGALELSETGSEAVILEKPGDCIGPYKLLEKIGEGGWGVVYRAQQEEPLPRQVALKIIKVGLDTARMIARFDLERRALALMEHPNIARVLDAGATQTGRPYFVMELVTGPRITDYCDQQQLSTVERLNLFTQVCKAVQHAHTKGIIHRDLKPSNVLVGLQEGQPVPKVIDFGIAKAAQQEEEQTELTGAGQFIGTVAYMSPEQVEPGSDDIDTRSDIYGLGVLLYELLTGRMPFERQELLRAGLGEIRRRICQEEPPKPSTRLARLAAGDLTSVAQRHRTQPPTLLHSIRGDLDWIVMKALEKDRTRRYETAIALAADIRRHLDNEEVAARPPSKLYRLQKLLQRNKLAVCAAGAVFVALVLGLGVSTWLLFRERAARQRADAAEREQSRLRAQAQESQRREVDLRKRAEANQKKAQTEAEKSKQVAQFLKEMLNGVGPSAAKGRDTAMLRDILDRTAARLGPELTNQPEVEADLRSILGQVNEDLGNYPGAELMQRQAIDRRRAALGGAEDDLKVAASLNSLGVALEREGKLAEAEPVYREGLALRHKLQGAENAELAKNLSNLGNLLWRLNRLAEAEAAYLEALSISKKTLGHGSAQVGAITANLAILAATRGKPAEAESLFRQTLALDLKLLGSDHPTIAKDLSNLGNSLQDQGRRDEAEEVYWQAVALGRKVLDNQHPDLAIWLNNLGELLAAKGCADEAAAIHQECVAIRLARLGSQHLYTALSLFNLARALHAQGRLTEAEIMYREALAIRQHRWAEHPHIDVAQSLDGLAHVLTDAGKLAEAEAAERESLALLRDMPGDQGRDIARAVARLDDILSRQKAASGTP
ncbi:MAG: serine/threonine protein kinase [Verrucomicrobia bacterium]|nr:MAG: serine/threonine protein kinase [Verrucomicrobiota bacterium]